MRGLSMLSGARLVAVALTVVLLAGCGDDKADKPKVRANPTDMAFATEMLDHHERGIDAADLAKERAKDPVIRRSARDLILLQSLEVQVLRAVRRTLAEAGVEKGDLGVPESTLDAAAAASRGRLRRRLCRGDDRPPAGRDPHVGRGATRKASMRSCAAWPGTSPTWRDSRSAS